MGMDAAARLRVSYSAIIHTILSTFFVTVLKIRIIVSVQKSR